MNIKNLEEWYPLSTTVKFTVLGLGISGGDSTITPETLGVVIGYIPADRYHGCRLVIEWSDETITSVFASQVERIDT